jgi:hypothetical protein
LAVHVTTMKRTDSVRRQVFRFFQHVELDGAMTPRVDTELLIMRDKLQVFDV